MGQKINPIGLRLGINRGWDSTWFAKKKDFGKEFIELARNVYKLNDERADIKFKINEILNSTIKEVKSYE